MPNIHRSPGQPGAKTGETGGTTFFKSVLCFCRFFL